VSKIFKAGGLLSSHERYRRGLLFDGNSTEADLDNGGGDSVFVRTITREGLKFGGNDERDRFYTGDTGIILFHPRIFDRTDWYAYPCDKWGTTKPSEFTHRQSPEQVFSEQKDEGYDSGNEQMFRQGISSDDFLVIIFDEVSDMLKMARQLRGDGVTTTQGVPIEEKIALIETYGDLLKISGGEEAMTLSKLIKENPEKVLEGEWKSVLLMTNNIEHWVDRGNLYAEEFTESAEWGSQNLPGGWDINFLLKSIENFSKKGIVEYVKEYFGDAINTADIPEKFKADMLAKLKLLPGSLTNLIASFHKGKNMPFYITDNLEEYTRRVKKTKRGIVHIIRSLENQKN
jgi:hypothetical protein